MKRWVLLIVIILGVFGGLGWWLRVDRYIDALWAIRDLPKPLWRQAYSQTAQAEGGERGILARVSRGGVWVWRGGWVEYVQVDQDTIYSYWHACDGLPSSEQLREGVRRAIERDVTASLVDWDQRMQPGNVVDVYFVGDIGGGVAREIYGYDWRLYLPLPASLETQCKR